MARVGGDEFIALLRNIHEQADCAAVAQKLADSLTQPFDIGGHVIQVSVSIGIALYPEHGRGDLGRLLKHADEAMYEAKQGRGGRLLFYAGRP